MLLEESVYDSFLTYHLLSCRNSITHLSNWTETCPVSGVPYPLLPIGVIRSYTHHPHGQCFRCLYYYFKELLQIYESFFKLPNLFWIFFLRSERQDLNLRPPAPKAGALPTAPLSDLRKRRDSNPWYLSVRWFSRPVHSTTLPLFRWATNQTWTDDRLITNQLLYQLSYSGL